MEQALKLKLSNEGPFVHALNDLYLVERALVGALTKMSVAVSSPNLAAAFNQHQQETREHERRMEVVLFNATELRPIENAAHSLSALITEGEQILPLPKSPSKDLAIIELARRVEQREMGLYANLIQVVHSHNLPDELVDMLSQTWAEEKEADTTLLLLANEFVNLAPANNRI